MKHTVIAIALAVALGCGDGTPESAPRPVRIIVDSDANNELDDQHALAYALLNPGAFTVEGITVNRTESGGSIEDHLAEAMRVTRLVGRTDVPVLRGASASFEEIEGSLDSTEFDGAAAVEFIIARAEAETGGPLMLVPIGKLTNIALALKKAPQIAKRVRIVWLGSNYPQPGEYNQANDEPALTYVLETDVPFEIVLVRYGEPTGTDAVRVTPAEIRENMAGRGPRIVPPVTGRDGAAFETFGDYSVSLFEGIDLYGDPPGRALFDMAAVAIVKDPSWAAASRIPAPRLVDGEWENRPENRRTIVLWERFDRDRILADFYGTFESNRSDRPIPGSQRP